jgi:hypothetical protein
MLVRICVECGEEFRPDVLRCSDCGGELVAHDDQHPGADPGAPALPRAGVPGEPLEAARPIAWSEQARDLIPFADRLVEGGLVFRIGPRAEAGEKAPPGFALRVADKDHEPATRLLAPFVTPESGVTLLAPVPAEEETGGSTCPACDTSLPPGAEQCPECGLAFGGEPNS